jgi:uncharacterized protein (TIGR03118 family)
LNSSLLPGVTPGKRQRDKAGPESTKESVSMKTFLRLTFSTGMVLATGAVSFGQHYTQNNLVSSTPGVAHVTDPQLVNPWGISRTSGSPWWISDNGTGLSTLYIGDGAKQGLVVTIPPSNPNNKKTPTGTPTGTIANSSATDFLLAPKMPAAFLFSTLDGTIAAWNSGVAVAPGAMPPSTHAVTVARGANGSSYTGLTSAFINGQRYLYAANFTKGSVDVYNNAFHPVTLPRVQEGENPHDDFAFDEDHGGNGDRPFVDERLPRNFVPFNVQAIGNDIVVTYVLHQDGAQFETDGPGLGYVDIYSSSGQLLRRLQHGDWLNAPWGVALAPLDFGRFSHDLLVAQFAGGGTTQSSGFIAAYDLSTGKLDGLLQDASGNTLSINGIWAISPGNVSPANSDPAGAPGAELYFTALRNKGTGGLFGYLSAASAELIKGNDQ